MAWTSSSVSDGNRDERSVGPELVQVVTDEVLRRVDLGPVRAVQLQLAHRSTRQPGSVDVLPVREPAEEAGHGVGRGSRPARVQRLPRHLHARPANQTGVDRVAQLDRAEPAARIHVDDGGEAGVQIALRALDHHEGPMLDRLVRRRTVGVDVPVDHARQQRRRAEIDDARARRHLHGPPDLGDPVAANQDGLTRCHRAGIGIEQPRRAHRDDLGRRGEVRRFRPPALLRADDGAEGTTDCKHDTGEPRCSAHALLRLKPPRNHNPLRYTFRDPRTPMKLAQKMSRIGTESAFEVLARARALEKQGRNVIHLEIGEPDFPTPRAHRRGGQARARRGLDEVRPDAGLPGAARGHRGVHLAHAGASPSAPRTSASCPAASRSCTSS